MRPNVQHLRDRAELLRELRDYFDSRGFLEVQPPCLSRDCVVDPYIDPIVIDSGQLGVANLELPHQLFLQTSPEAAMKRMLASGAPSIYSIGPVFRSGEEGAMHNTEFTMLEWYEVGGDMESGVRLLGTLAAEILKSDGYDTITYRAAFEQHMSIDPINVTDQELQSLVADVDTRLAESIQDRDGRLDVLLSERIQPRLGKMKPIVVTNYPLSQAALAKPSTTDPACAARFELFADGVELANGYDELLDAEILVQRAKTNNALRKDSGRSLLSVESALVNAMRDGLPQSAGVALGVDRLMMLRTGADAIDQVIPFTISKA